MILMETLMSEPVIDALTLTDLRELLQQAGYRVQELADLNGVKFLQSATGGMGFDLRPGNQLPGAAAGHYADLRLQAVAQIQGDLPAELVARWNNTRRFGRLRIDQNFLVCEMDVSVLGGVTNAYVRAQFGLWDQLMQDLVAYLRDELRKLTATNEALAAAPAGAMRRNGLEAIASA
jgi:hypothetical protein